ncbi:MAG TPA: hypothetical protein VH562_03490 [Nitrosopumilaceae archaeon]|jgi:hypothetical protein
MNIQEKAFHIIYDIIGVVIKWDKNQLSDKEAMNGIVDILASHAEDEKENEIKNIKKLDYFKFQKKLVAPLAISVIFVGILFGTGILNHIFTIPETQTSVNENKVGFEQLNEEPSDTSEKILNNTTVEEFSNITNFNQG